MLCVEHSVSSDIRNRRFIAEPTLNNSKKKVEFFWKLSLIVVENVAKVEFFFFSFLSRMHFFHFN